MEEKRTHERIRARLGIKVTWPEKGSLVGNTLDFSDGGVFVLVTFELPPQVGKEMLLQLNSR